MAPKKRPRPNATTMKMVGAQVAVCRVAKHLTQKQLGDLIGLHSETVASIEQGRRVLMPDVAELMDRALGLPGVLTVAATQMPQVDVTPPWVEEYLDLEFRALALSWYDTLVVPGLLQTDDYARAVFGCRIPAMGEVEIDLQITNRMQRQQILTRPIPPVLSFILWEPIIRTRISGDEVYWKQMQHLRTCMDRPTMSIQILPLSRDTHAGLDGPFILLETPERQVLGYSETQQGSHLVSDPNEVGILTQRYGMLRSQALNVDATRDLLDQLLGER
ncbi:Scr1 family TA system antitoxin-like transcriptional regulator [Streptomyces sp. NPDC051567]|uniref:helix-turn-helix domain-containing protein n=1 Tax=Streptomyces sp. NPDC051567 TaxID=3365660 RepID=UPI00379CEACA